MKIDLYNIIYNSGDVFLPPLIKKILDKDIIGNSKKTFYISGWTFMHFFSGIISAYFLIKYFKNNNKPLVLSNYLLYSFILHSLWELWQIIIGMSRPYTLYGRSNIIDTLIDTISFMLGSYIYLVLSSNNI